MITTGIDKKDGNIRCLVLILLCVQTAAGAALVNYSNLIGDNKFNNIDLVMCSEIVKLVVSSVLSITAADNNNNRKGFSWLLKVLLNGKKTVVLVIMYSVSNLLAYSAVSKIGAPTFTVVSVFLNHFS